MPAHDKGSKSSKGDAWHGGYIAGWFGFDEVKEQVLNLKSLDPRALTLYRDLPGPGPVTGTGTGGKRTGTGKRRVRVRGSGGQVGRWVASG